MNDPTSALRTMTPLLLFLRDHAHVGDAGCFDFADHFHHRAVGHALVGAHVHARFTGGLERLQRLAHLADTLHHVVIDVDLLVAGDRYGDGVGLLAVSYTHLRAHET